METYTYSCPTCGAPLEYDAVSKKMLCQYCMQYYDPEQIEAIEAKKINARLERDIHSSAGESQASDSGISDENAMDVRIYSCSKCGAQIMTNDVEVSTFCSYCASPTLIFDRVSREQKPDKIIPFSISKEDALAKAKEKFAKAQFVGNEIENLTVESVYGIYMPYYRYDVVGSMELYVQKKYSGNNGYRHEYADTVQKEVLADASRSFNDSVAACLSPYHMKDAVPFSSTYLSGAYGDRKDDNEEKMERQAKAKVKDLLVNKLLDKCPDVPKEAMRKNYDMDNNSWMQSYTYEITSESCEAKNKEYIFLPVYFITFKIMGEKVIILVNGQTGKVVGNIPVNKELFKKKQTMDMVIFSAIFAAAGFILLGFLDVIWGVCLLGIVCGFAILSGRKANKDYMTRYEKTNSENMFTLTRRRRD